MKSRTATIVLLTGLGLSLMALVSQPGGWHIPGNQQGYEPLRRFHGC